MRFSETVDLVSGAGGAARPCLQVYSRHEGNQDYGIYALAEAAMDVAMAFMKQEKYSEEDTAAESVYYDFWVPRCKFFDAHRKRVTKGTIYNVKPPPPAAGIYCAVPAPRSRMSARIARPA